MKDDDLLREMHRALLAEFGARAIYRQLSRVCRDAALREFLTQFAEDESEQIRELRAIIERLGGRAPRKSFRRWILATILALGSALIGVRPALRLCEEAEGTAARWYVRFGHVLAGRGELGAARTLAGLAIVKQRHGRVLRTWVTHGGGR